MVPKSAVVLSALACFSVGCEAPIVDASDPSDSSTEPIGESVDEVVTGTLYVSPSGSDAASGSAAAPFRTISKGLRSVTKGGTLYIRGGTYVENVTVTASRGTPTNPVLVTAYPGERPVIKGLLRIWNADYWTIDRINVTWNDANASSEHMVKLSGGTGWRLTNAELSGAKSFAALLVSGGARNFYVGQNRIHHTHKSNATNQDHLVYLNQVDGGIVERNELWESPNGRAIKVGNVGGSTGMPRKVVIRYNTMYRNLGPSNVQLSYAANGCEVYRNIMVGSSAENITAYNLSGSGNSAHDNIGFESKAVTEVAGGLVDAGGNLRLDPQLLNPASGAFHPRNPAASNYGRFAPSRW